MLEFLHKGDHISSITGEKITESQVVAAVRAASESVGMSLQQFTVTPVWGQPPAYRMYVDVSSSVTPDDDQLNRLADATDRELNHLNCEYEDKRSTARLGALQCEVLPRSAWQTYASARLAASGGSPEQYKHACLVPDSRFENRFLAMTQKAAESGGRP